MKTLHSIDLKKTDDTCFGKNRMGACTVLAITAWKCGCECPFYKPIGCRDWIRIDDKYGSNLIPPEEFENEIRRRNE